MLATGMIGASACERGATPESLPPASSPSPPGSPGSPRAAPPAEPAAAQPRKIPEDASAGLTLAEASALPQLHALMSEREQLVVALGLPPLSQGVSGAGYELRAWFRLNERRLLLRVWQDSNQGAPQGAAWVWWDAGPQAHYMHDEIDSWVDCPIATPSGDALESCRVHFPETHDWRTTLARLDKVQVWTLPDMSELATQPDPQFARELVWVEMRDGDRLRNFHYQDIEDIEGIEDKVDVGANQGGAAALMGFREALWDSFTDAEWTYDARGEPIKERRPAPS